MILRGLFAASLSILLSGATLTGVARAFAWPAPPPPPIRYHDPADPGPLIITADAIDAERPSRPCPAEPMIDWLARPVSAPGPVLHGFGAARFSPGYCVRIGDDGRVRSLYLADTSGDARVDRALSAEIRRTHFTAARRGDTIVSAWHRVVVNLPARPAALAIATRHSPLLTLHWYVG